MNKAGKYTKIKIIKIIFSKASSLKSNKHKCKQLRLKISHDDQILI